MPTQLEKDAAALVDLAKIAKDIADAVPGMPSPEERAAIIGASMSIIAQAYLEDRETYTKDQPPSPPTGVIDYSI